jgi:hypothetical protein
VPQLTTAQALARYYNELVDEGIPHETAHELLLDAGRRLLDGADLVVTGTGTGEVVRVVPQAP